MPLPRSLLTRLEPEARDLRVIQGAWPDDIDGEISISAPHPRYFDGPHAFFGDGIHHRLSLRPGRFRAPPDAFAWRWHWVDSPSARLRCKRPELFATGPAGTISPFGFSNAANTAPLPWKDRLFLTWDVGRPVEVDPVSMRFLGEVGHRSEWREMLPQPVLPMIASTAHPVIDPERDCLWTVNTCFGQLELLRWDGEGPLRRWPVEGAAIPQSLHTVAITRDWIVIADCAYKVEPQQLAGGERKEMNNPSGPLYLIRKDTVEKTPTGRAVPCKTFRLAPEVMHYYGVWDDRNGVRVVFEHTQDMDMAIPLREGDVDAWGRPCDPIFRGLYHFAMSPSRQSVIDFDPERGKLQERALLVDPETRWSQQLSAFDGSPEGLAKPRVRHMVYHGWRPEAVSQRVLSLYRERVDPSSLPREEIPARITTLSMPDLRPLAEHTYPLDELPSSPVYVPRSTGSAPGGDDGYLVVPVYADGGFRVELFDAGRVGAGPIATLASPRHEMPFLIHAAWLPRAVPAPDVARTRFADELGGAVSLPDELADLARGVAQDLDEGVPLG